MTAFPRTDPVVLLFEARYYRRMIATAAVRGVLRMPPDKRARAAKRAERWARRLVAEMRRKKPRRDVLATLWRESFKTFDDVRR